MNISKQQAPLIVALMALALVLVGLLQSWSLALTILNYGLIAGIMALGLNIQWGYAGLFNVGLMGFAALGGIAAVLVSMEPVPDAWAAGGAGIGAGVLVSLATIALAILAYRRLPKGGLKAWVMTGVIVLGYVVARYYFDPAVASIESVNPAQTGFLGGLGLPIAWAWLVGGLLAAGVAAVIGKVTLGLRSDYLAIATLGISEIIIAVLKNEDWLTRGVKNVNGLSRPVPFEYDLQQTAWAQEWAARFGAEVQDFASIYVKLCYAGLILAILLALFWLAQTAIKSPWGRMMYAIRDNETAAEAMGKNVKRRHLQVFILGSAIVGLAGAMMTTMDGQFTPTTYNPLRFTFLIWVMVIVGGSGNNLGAIVGGFIIWFFWVQAEPMGYALLNLLTSGMAEDSGLRAHLLDSAAHMRLITMGLILLITLRFRPRGLLPERAERTRSGH
ncbi:branched-chain amino acid ABC transporter permease [Comamonadaceae bacterium M7527]|nr:branched-chain amino acid ABC transporter permease [Comamonadaceae bacterium M7527]